MGTRGRKGPECATCASHDLDLTRWCDVAVKRQMQVQGCMEKGAAHGERAAFVPLCKALCNSAYRLPPPGLPGGELKHGCREGRLAWETSLPGERFWDSGKKTRIEDGAGSIYERGIRSRTVAPRLSGSGKFISPELQLAFTCLIFLPLKHERSATAGARALLGAEEGHVMERIHLRPGFMCPAPRPLPDPGSGRSLLPVRRAGTFAGFYPSL